jgi:hypothetical protein
MAAVELRSGTVRYVLFLESPTRAYRNELEGDLRDHVDTQVNQFLEEATPESALQAEGKFSTPLRQLKSRGGQVRGIGVWCQGEGYDLFILQILFRKGDEDRVYAKQEPFRYRGEQLVDRFGGIEKEAIEEKADEWRSRDDFLLFSSSR